MFSVEYLHVIREFEYKKILNFFSSGSRVLEIGGGTGYQAKRLSEDGFWVESIDIPNSNYTGQHEFPVRPYDGKNIPFPDGYFDIIFSSNVLEHVSDLAYLQTEIKRVLKFDGVCVHLMPTGAWRFWTNLAHYIELVQRLTSLIPRLIPRGLSRDAIVDSLNVLRMVVGNLRQYAIAPRHGESGNALSEIVTFSPWCWKRHFVREYFSVERAEPTGLFYTGHMVLGSRLSIRSRQKIAKWLGSACVIYVVRPN